MKAMTNVLAWVGRHGLVYLQTVGSAAILLKKNLRWMGRMAIGRATAPGLAGQMVRVGVHSIPIVLIVNLFIGAIIAVSMGEILGLFDMTRFTADVVGVSITRELAPLMTAIVMSGFVGAAMASEIGSMTVNEEVLAMEVSALHPIRFLVLPRLLAVMIMMPCLTILADCAGLLGGYLVGTNLLGIIGEQYIWRTLDRMYLRDLINGLIKAEAFAVIITIVACNEGLKVTGGAQGVGRAATRAVVLCIVTLISADLLMVILFNYVLA